MDNPEDDQSQPELVDKDVIPHFLPTYRISNKFYPIPIIVVIIIAGILAYLTYFGADVQYDGGYFPEEELGAWGAILNGIVFTALAAISAFIIIFLVKKKGIDVLKYVFGLTFAILGFTMTYFFSDIITILILNQFPITPQLDIAASIVVFIVLPIFSALLTGIIIYKYFTSKSIRIKNTIVLYISLLISASMSIILPLWTTLAILIGISLWDIFAVRSRRGPIREMIEIASENGAEDQISEKEEIDRKIQQKKAIFDTSKVEIGIGDLAFYSLLTSTALIRTNNVFVMILTALAIIIGTGITISYLKRNKILPGLPISIFLGIGTMLLSWLIFTLIGIIFL